MASPTADTYSVASGQPVAGGRYRLPTWVPAMGTLADVSINTMNSVRGTEDFYGVASMLDHWSGCAYAKDYGALGSLIFTGGGHDAGKLNSVYRYDIATRTHSRIKEAASYIAVASNEYIADTATGWMWLDTGKTTLQVGEPFAAHMYANIVALPPSAIAGGENGWLISAGRTVMPRAGSAGTARVHKLKLGVDQQFSLHGGAMPDGGAGYGASVYDPSRGRLVSFQGSERSNFCYMDLTTESTTTVNYSSSQSVNAYYCAAFYDADSDLYYVAKCGSPYTLYVIDPVTNTRYIAATSGTSPATAGGGWEWVPEWGTMVYYAGSGNTLFFLKRPANPRTGIWVWSSQTLTGTARATNGEAPHYNRLRWVSSAECFVWASQTSNPIQAFRAAQP